MDSNPKNWFINGYGLILEKNRRWTPLLKRTAIQVQYSDSRKAKKIGASWFMAMDWSNKSTASTTSAETRCQYCTLGSCVLPLSNAQASEETFRPRGLETNIMRFNQSTVFNRLMHTISSALIWVQSCSSTWKELQNQTTKAA
jgi:hypothetical protein